MGSRKKFNSREHEILTNTLKKTTEKKRCDRCFNFFPRKELEVYGDDFLCVDCRSKHMMLD